MLPDYASLYPQFGTVSRDYHEQFLFARTMLSNLKKVNHVK